MGEFKHVENCTAKKTRTQCIVHLPDLLHWPPVSLRKPVDAVDGFFLHGFSFGDQEKTHSVGLVKLNNPTKLAELVQLKFFGKWLAWTTYVFPVRHHDCAEVTT